MSNIFGNLNQNAQSPYVDMETNKKAKDYIFSRLGKIKKVFWASEDGESDTNDLNITDSEEKFNSEPNIHYLVKDIYQVRDAFYSDLENQSD